VILVFSLIAFLSLAGCLYALFWPRPARIERERQPKVLDLTSRRRVR